MPEQNDWQKTTEITYSEGKMTFTYPGQPSNPNIQMRGTFIFEKKVYNISASFSYRESDNKWTTYGVAVSTSQRSAYKGRAYDYIRNRLNGDTLSPIIESMIPESMRLYWDYIAISSQVEYRRSDANRANRILDETILSQQVLFKAWRAAIMKEATNGEG